MYEQTFVLLSDVNNHFLIILLRPGVKEFSIFGNSTHSHSRTRHSQNERDTTPNKDKTLYCEINIHVAGPSTSTWPDSSTQTCWKHPRLSSPGNTDFHVPAFGDQ